MGCEVESLNDFTGTLQSNILATPPANSFPVTATNGPIFYRLRF